MKLSEAIRLGIGMVEENRNIFLANGCGCALGTAFAAMGETVLTRAEDVAKYWPWVLEWCPGTPGPYAHEISFQHFRGLSREAVADYVETIEPQEEESHHDLPPLPTSITTKQS